MKSIHSFATLAAFASGALAANFSLVQDYSGTGFFDAWDFYGNFDNLTNGDVTYVNQTNATNLAYVDPAGHVIIKVDNTSFVPYNDKRNSVRITTKDYFTPGTIWVVDAAHLPFGCSVWPSIWTKGNNWPQNGEIDIIEGVNLMTFNQMALHTQPGCLAANGTTETGQSGGGDCSVAAGCTVVEKTPNSYGEAFASVGGGVWATQFDVTGIFIWFWQRPDVPASITTATDSIDISTWGNPSAAWPASSCNIPQFFGAQQLVIDITLCGDWAGVPSIYSATCGDAATNACYLDNVINNGTAQYANAYFDLNYIRAFAVNSSVIVNADGGAVTSGAGAPSSTGAAGPGASSGASTGGSGSSSGATILSPAAWLAALAGAVGTLGMLAL
ncbi:glycoside hydrolase family 16 protein [Phanerochaete sordida]|uniref:Glycoside hydrolase family 16 protein n=1 Tax=Phanerochaete sordida TaxID=48140 RepID=A0A9P3LBA5_9APHY|nr:glycoside hydrolase family 16 protein [Phanerochaete sordida]